MYMSGQFYKNIALHAQVAYKTTAIEDNFQRLFYGKNSTQKIGFF